MRGGEDLNCLYSQLSFIMGLVVFFSGMTETSVFLCLGIH